MVKGEVGYVGTAVNSELMRTASWEGETGKETAVSLRVKCFTTRLHQYILAVAGSWHEHFTNMEPKRGLVISLRSPN
jgi:hypothetical protein